MTGRQFNAAEAEKLRFTNATLADRDAVLAHTFEIARSLAAKSPIALRGTKETLNFSRDHSISEGLEFVAARNAALLFAPDIAEAIAAQSERRVPRFDD